MKPAIRVQNVSKCYRVGAAPAGGRNLSESVRSAARATWRKVKQLAAPGAVAADERFWSLKDVSFEVRPGEVVGVVGRNGAGKSTLLKVLSRITVPTEGRVEIRGRMGSLLEVGTGFHPELTGRENVYLNGSILGMTRKEIDRKFDAIVDFAEVEKFLDTPVKRYSSGMYVRLAFAVAAHLEPEILIVDEVLAVGDAAFQKKCIGKMREASRGGRTVLFVSHNVGTVHALCQSALWLAGGRAVEYGPAGAVADRYTRSLATPGSARVSLADAPNRSGGGEVRLTELVVNDGQPVVHGRPLTVRVRYRAVRDAAGVSFGFGLSDLSGVRILSADGDYAGRRHDLAAGAVGEIGLRVPALPVQPGMYLLDVGARSGDVQGLDYLPGCAQVEVVPGPETPAFIAHATGGGVRVPAEAVGP